MPLRRQPGGRGRGRGDRGLRRARTVAGIVAAIVLAVFLGSVVYKVYNHRSEVRRFFSNPPPPEPGTIDLAIEEAYAKIKPTEVTTTNAEIGGEQVREDRVLLPKTASLLRANAEIARAVESAGGEMAYGIESADDRGRKTGLTLGVSIDKKLVRQIRIEKSTR